MPTSGLSHREELYGKHIVVTRPSHQAESLCKQIENAGGRALRLPLLEIADPEDISKVMDLLERLKDFDIAIFISPNAVLKATELMKVFKLSLPPQIKIAAIGRKTAMTLDQQGYQADITPEQGFTSEDFLCLPQIQHVRHKRIIIFRGIGGREFLGNELIERGAKVEYVELYRRIKPDINDPQIKRIFSTEKIDLVMITSSQIVQNLHELIHLSGQSRMFNLHLLVGSNRMAEQARHLGFSKIDVAADPSDESMYIAILKWARKQEHLL
jgi:uroporphyrinogen-III synthase